MNSDTFEHACREADRKAAARPQDRRLERLRRLLEDDVSLERAWAELNRGDSRWAALAVWGFCEDSTTQIWGDMIGDDVADAILAALKTAGLAGMGRTEMSNLFSRHVSSARITMTLESLQRAEKAEQMPGPTVGHG